MLYRASFGYLLRHPWQLGLALLGICIGVAVMVAVDLAIDSSRAAFRLSMNTINGAATHQVVGGPRGVDEQFYVRLRVDEGMRHIAPVVDGYLEYGGTALRLLGVDLFAELDFRDYGLPPDAKPGDSAPAWPDILRRFLSEPGALLMSGRTAAANGLQVGDQLQVVVDGSTHTAVLAGVFPGERRELANIVVADIGVAQRWLASDGFLSRIDVRSAADDGDALADRIRALLPPGVQLLKVGDRSRSVAEMSNAFMTNLTAMSLLAMLVGIFLIYNSAGFAVLQRRGLIGVLRALGLTRNEVFRLILIEGVALGVAGAVLGVALGIWLGEHLLALVARSINDLYFRLSVTGIAVSPWSVARGFGAGLAATLIAAAVPAIEAASYRPQLALTRSVLEHRSGRLLPRIAAAGVATAALALLLLKVSGTSLVAGLSALFLLLLGGAVCIPLLVKTLTDWLAPLAGKAGGTPVRLAISGVGAAISRTGVAIVALAVAVSATIGVTLMVDSFRGAVSVWLQDSLRSDIYLRAPYGRLEPELVDKLVTLPGVAAYSARRLVWLESPAGRTLIIAVQMAPGSYAGIRMLDADPDRAWRQFEQEDAVLVTESFAYRNRLGSGDTLHLPTPAGDRPFQVAATYRSYAGGSGAVLMNRRSYVRYWQDTALDSLGIYLAPGADAGTVTRALRQASEGRQALLVQSNRELLDRSLQIFDRTFVITGVLYWLAVGVAIIGILGAMLSLQLERARELAVLRAIGMTPGQLGAMVTLQSGFMGLLSGLAAMPLGLLMAWILIDVINRRAFGWSMAIEVAPGVLVTALALSVGAALLAGLYPAYRAASAQPALAMREE